jgi:regulator of sirC expression with transglutaminase-like and TPR domain
VSGDVGFAFMYFYKIATIVLASAVINLTGFAFAPPISVRTAQAEAGTVSRTPFTNQAEENDYSNASGQTDAAAKVTAINAFLAKYPASHAREDLLEQLMAVYVREPDMNKATETAARILSVDPKNLRALFYVTYVDKEKALSANAKDARALLDNAASEAKLALDSPSKPDYLTPLEFQRLRVVTAPNFYCDSDRRRRK